MITAIKKRMQVRSEGGFTLIELLVVIIIIAILAAIAIPMYLSQRQKGWDANVQSDLRNAAVAQESYYTSNSTYVTPAQGIAPLVGAAGQGFNPSANVTTTIVSGDATGYCMEAVHSSNPGKTWSFNSANGDPQAHACP